MDIANVWKFLHIASMFLAVSIFVGQGMLSGAVGRSGDVQALRRVLAAEDRFTPLGGAAFLLGIVFGFLTAIVADVDLTQTWLLIAYALSLFILVNGVTYHRVRPSGSRRRRRRAQTSGPPARSARSPVLPAPP